VSCHVDMRFLHVRPWNKLTAFEDFGLAIFRGYLSRWALEVGIDV